MRKAGLPTPPTPYGCILAPVTDNTPGTRQQVILIDRGSVHTPYRYGQQPAENRHGHTPQMSLFVYMYGNHRRTPSVFLRDTA